MHARDPNLLRAIKLLHTAVWAVMAGCIVAMPIAAWQGRPALAFWLGAVVAIEVCVLALNRWRCPMTNWAARYTDARQDNFDIYLPLWLARHNKTLFGTLYVAGIAFALWQWRRQGGRAAERPLPKTAQPAVARTVAGRAPSSRVGSISSACRNANSAENVMPTSRNGSDSSQTTGHNTSASNASGQHSTSSTHQASRAISVFIVGNLANGG